jgi:putative protein-disulfide isomerase
MDAIARACAGLVPIRLCAGGLRAGETRPMDDRSRGYVRHHWEQVAAQTGQPFDFRFFDRPHFVYDTEPACRAVVAIRNLVPDATLAYLAAVQRAFYAENRDASQEDELASVASSFVSPEDFRAVFRAPEVHQATRADFRLTQGLGIQGFPTVLLQDGRQLTVLTTGWQPFGRCRNHCGRGSNTARENRNTRSRHGFTLPEIQAATVDCACAARDDERKIRRPCRRAYASRWDIRARSLAGFSGFFSRCRPWRRTVSSSAGLRSAVMISAGTARQACLRMCSMTSSPVSPSSR